MPRYTDIMLDLETLGLSSASVILSIGAVKFTTDGEMDDNAFYAVCSVESQKNRETDPSTLAWWEKQSEAARAVLTDERKQPIKTALISFLDWVGKDQYCVWSNGADFDIPMLIHALKQNDMVAPWPFWNHRCFRTLKSIPPGMYVQKPKQPKIAHNALDDAVAQTQYLHAIYAAIKAGTAVSSGFSAKK